MLWRSKNSTTYQTYEHRQLNKGYLFTIQDPFNPPWTLQVMEFRRIGQRLTNCAFDKRKTMERVTQWAQRITMAVDGPKRCRRIVAITTSKISNQSVKKITETNSSKMSQINLFGWFFLHSETAICFPIPKLNPTLCKTHQKQCCSFC